MTEPLEYQITLYPDPLLRKPSEPVTAFDDELAAVVAAMFERMRASKGVGLAAPQVGLKRRILVLNHTGEEGDDLALVNSEILELAGPRTTYEEGCLSFPGIYGEVLRPDRCKVRYQTLAGETVEREFEGFQSRVIQHEQDHLEGVLLIDRMSPADKLRNKIAFDNLVYDYKQALAKAGR
ncbi:MAG: peptide deformylase [Planctomycetes bacterium]|nr:peptide deformylase [Planctomycetota bacterium]